MFNMQVMVNCVSILYNIYMYHSLRRELPPITQDLDGNTLGKTSSGFTVVIRTIYCTTSKATRNKLSLSHEAISDTEISYH